MYFIYKINKLIFTILSTMKSDKANLYMPLSIGESTRNKNTFCPVITLYIYLPRGIENPISNAMNTTS